MQNLPVVKSNQFSSTLHDLLERQKFRGSEFEATTDAPLDCGKKRAGDRTLKEAEAQERGKKQRGAANEEDGVRADK